MGSNRVRVLLSATLLVTAGAGGTIALSHGLYANAAIAVIALVLLTAGLNTLLQRTPPAAADPKAETTIPLRDAREQRRLRSLLDLSPAPLLAREPDGRLSAINRAARRLFGVDDRIEAPPAELAAAIASAVPGQAMTLRLTLDDAERAFALTTADLVAGASGTRIAALVDVEAELKAVEAATLRELMQVLSHEIMNSLTPVASLSRTAVDILEDPAPDLDHARDAMRTVATRTEGLQRFILAYRDMARLPPPELRSVALAPLLDDLERLFSTHWEGRVMLSLDRSGAPQHIVADDDQLHAALWALLQNAAEAAGEPGQVHVTLSADAAALRIRIADNGPGVAPENRNAIFDLFFSQKSGGSGIGLTLARQIFRAHRGDLVLGPAGNPGAVFDAQLPRR
ncbi:sensor histidine kinase [Stakelama tenebrarum]|uniref:histidine kinase n=1 Tax=Stakelama tenebrarum TaxID=2711215 RepID=A0A6G6YAI3_9SPHN|nr:ATP-binding protein [Sphingosinithalassobacter tenebrarum]QIG81586.1 PAS domain-containing protein [Sphingosinithalassobacter tenebrarum]